MCNVPITIRNKAFGKKPNQRPFLHVPCGKCATCLVRKRNLWSYRIWYEMKDHIYTSFVTLTYATENNTLCKRHIQNFIKSIRNKGRKVRYFIVGEYGSRTNRAHYHAILFSIHPNDPVIRDSWPHGFIYSVHANIATAKYVAKYVIKVLPSIDNTQVLDRVIGSGDAISSNISESDISNSSISSRSFMLCSRKPMIGNSYIEKMSRWHSDDPSRMYSPYYNGKMPLHRGFRSKMGINVDHYHINIDVDEQKILNHKQQLINFIKQKSKI